MVWPPDSPVRCCRRNLPSLHGYCSLLYPHTGHWWEHSREGKRRGGRSRAERPEGEQTLLNNEKKSLPVGDVTMINTTDTNANSLIAFERLGTSYKERRRCNYYLRKKGKRNAGWVAVFFFFFLLSCVRGLSIVVQYVCTPLQPCADVLQNGRACAPVF
jgi:hypothetical protein